MPFNLGAVLKKKSSKSLWERQISSLSPVCGGEPHLRRWITVESLNWNVMTEKSPRLHQHFVSFALRDVLFFPERNVFAKFSLARSVNQISSPPISNNSNLRGMIQPAVGHCTFWAFLKKNIISRLFTLQICPHCSVVAVTSNNKETKVGRNYLPYICHCHWETGRNTLFIFRSGDPCFLL